MLTTLLTLVCLTQGLNHTYRDCETLDPVEVAENDTGSPADNRDLCEALTGRYPDLAYVTEESLDSDPNDCSRGIDEANQSTCGDL